MRIAHSFALILVAGALLLFGSTTQADEQLQPRPEILVSPEQLQASLDNPQLRVLDAAAEDAYRQGHIPGAVRLDLTAWKKLSLSPGGLQDAKAWSQRVGELGVSADSRVVVYGANPTNAARAWWTLAYAGVKHVALLDGGWGLWTQEKRPVSKDTPKVKATKFTAHLQRDRLEELSGMKQACRARASKSSTPAAWRNSPAKDRARAAVIFPAPSIWSGKN